MEDTRIVRSVLEFWLRGWGLWFRHIRRGNGKMCECTSVYVVEDVRIHVSIWPGTAFFADVAPEVVRWSFITKCLRSHHSDLRH